MAVQANIATRFKIETAKKFNQAALARAARAVGSEIINLSRERAASGIDVNGKRLQPLSKSYQKWKAQFIKRGFRYVRGKRKGKSMPQTEFAAKGVPNYMRLSGRMFSAMQINSARATQNGTTFGFGVSVGIDEGIAPHAKYHLGEGRVKRLWFGLSRKGTTSYDREQNRLKSVFKKALGL